MDYTSYKFALYARKSTEDRSRQVQSIADQINAMRSKAKSLDIKVKNVLIIQEAKSAKTPGLRTEFSKLVKLIQSGEVNALLCWSTNRLARNPQEAGIIQQLLQDEKLKCIVTNEKTYLPDDNAVVFAVEMGISSQFVRDLMQNVRRGMYSKAEKGWLPGAPPVGYKNDRETKTIIADPERFELVRRLWDFMLTGRYSVSKLARIADKEWGLTSYKRRNSGGKPLSVSVLYSVFMNPFYKGELHYAGKIYVGKHEAMVTAAEFNRVAGLIRRNNVSRPSKKLVIDPFEYRGLIKCGECGCAITYAKKTRHYKNGTSQTFEYCYCTRRRQDYDCSQRSSVTPEEITERLQAELKMYTILDDFFGWACKYIDGYFARKASEKAEQAALLEKQVEKTKSELLELNRMRYKKFIDDDFYSTERSVIEHRLASLSSISSDTQAAAEKLRLKAQKYFTFARYAEEDFLSGDVERRRRVVEIVCKNLVLKDGKLLFTPVKYLRPVIAKKSALKAEPLYVGTQNQSVMSNDFQKNKEWYTRQDLNLRPLAPQANALSS